MSGKPPLARGSVALTWLRQAGFIVEGPSGAVVIDPFLTEIDGLLVPPGGRPEDLAWVDAILATHEHADHLDLPAWRRVADISRRPVFVVPEPLSGIVAGAGIDPARVRGVRRDRPLVVGACRITAVPALHGTEVDDAYTHGRERSGGVDRYVGYVVELDGVRVYHAGDTIVYDDMVERLSRLDIHVALLPINGRDFFRERRGIVGNLDAREAAELAASIGASLVIPMHYDTVPGNTASVGTFVDHVRQAHPALSVLVPARGDRVVYTVAGESRSRVDA